MTEEEQRRHRLNVLNAQIQSDAQLVSSQRARLGETEQESARRARDAVTEVELRYRHLGILAARHVVVVLTQGRHAYVSLTERRDRKRKAKVYPLKRRVA